MTNYAIDGAAILAIDDFQREEVEVPEWGGAVIIMRGLSGDERDAFEASNTVGNGAARSLNLVGIRARLVQKCAITPSGESLFTADQVEALGAKNGAVLDRLFDVARKLSGMMPDAVTVTAGNSDPGPNV